MLRQGRSYTLAVAQQRGWDYTTPGCEDLDDDALGLDEHGEPRSTRIWLYEPTARTWDHWIWELAPLPANASWVGLSEITAAPDNTFVVLERDNRSGDWAELKSLVKFDPRHARDGVIRAHDKRVRDIIPALASTRGWISDKPEGVAITQYGKIYVVTDNDGVEDWSGETSFLELGRFSKFFGPKFSWFYGNTELPWFPWRPRLPER